MLGSLSELNITPLLDLAFVLLIIFMITAPFLAESANLVIPTSKASRDAIDPSKVFTVSVDGDGGLELNGVDVLLGELAPGILALRESEPDLAVLVRAHNALSIQTLIEVMDILKQSGVTQVGLVTKPDLATGSP